MISIWKRATILVLRYSIRKDVLRSLHTLNKNFRLCSTLPQLYSINQSTVNFSSRKQTEDDSDDEKDFDYNDDSSLSRDSKIVKFSTTSLRLDAIVKSALGIARNKIEQIFYESKIRLNGKKVLKKSASIKIGDEIDVIKSVSPKNPDHLLISRVEVMNVTASEENIKVTARRFKTLLIENYETDPYKGSADS